MKKYFKLIRIDHYFKNILIFIPIVFGKKLFDAGIFFKVLYSFFIFSLAASSVYIINDMKDLKKDRIHTLKCKRPLAAGEISLKQASFILTAILFIIIIMSIALKNVSAFIYIFVYILINICYSFGLKNIPIIDISIIAAGFIIRILYGAAVSGIELSSWMYLLIIAMSFYMGFGKRRNELTQENRGTRSVLNFYTHGFLDKNMQVCVVLIIVFYSFWCMESAEKIKNIMYTIPLVLVICMKYSLSIEGPSDGDSVNTILSDKFLLILLIIYAASIIILLYI